MSAINPKPNASPCRPRDRIMQQQAAAYILYLLPALFSTHMHVVPFLKHSCFQGAEG